jgi:D-sedoheptulose 7-phosphate isomerase
MSKHKLIQDLIRRYSDLEIVSKDIEDAYELLKNSFENSGKLLICGNGGSASDGDHIVGELMKRFSIPRAIPKNLKSVLVSDYGEKGKYMSEKLEGALPAISLNAHSTLSSAFANDVDAELIYAQQVVGYGNKEDVLMGISTSGNAKNVVASMIVAKAKGMKVLGLVGRDGGEFNKYCDVLINVGGDCTPQIQELHLPIYHVLCQTLEYHFFSETK